MSSGVLDNLAQPEVPSLLSVPLQLNQWCENCVQPMHSAVHCGIGMCSHERGGRQWCSTIGRTGTLDNGVAPVGKRAQVIPKPPIDTCLPSPLQRRRLRSAARSRTPTTSATTTTRAASAARRRPT